MNKRGIFALILVIFISLAFVSAFNFNKNIFAEKNVLRVTDEHPFFLNGSWVKASELNVGDELVNINGKIARIVNITDVDNRVLVYNLEAEEYNDFIVGEGVIVHNSNMLEFPIVRRISSDEIDNLYSEKTVLELLSTKESGIVKIDEGKIKEVYLINPEKVDLDKLPAGVRDIVEKSDGPVAIKYLRELRSNERRAFLFETEIELGAEVNKAFESRGMRKLIPEKTMVGSGITEVNGQNMFRGLIVEEVLDEYSVASLRTEIEKVSSSYALSSREAKRITDLRKKINMQSDYSIAQFDQVFKEEGFVWRDAHTKNFAIGIVDKTTGKKLTVDEVISGNYNIGSRVKDGDIEVYFMCYEVGFIARGVPGEGYFFGASWYMTF